MSAYKSHLHEMSQTTPTDYWNDSCNTDELAFALEHGAVGATSNPTIAHTVLKQQFEQWEGPIHNLIAGNPTASETDVTWRVIEEITLKAASLLLPVYERYKGLKGRIAIQVNPTYYRHAEKMIEQAVHFSSLAPNLTIKLPATPAGFVAAEELTYRGISTIATVSFTVPQVLAAAEATERGFERRLAEGKSIDAMTANTVVMVGRVDDWLKVVANREDITVTPGYLEWAGVAVLKNAYRLLIERGYRSRVMAAAYRNHYHWSQFIGGDLITTIPYKWARRFNASDVTAETRMDQPVDPVIVKELSAKFADFRRAYEPDGMTADEFTSYGATARTLRGFTQSYADLVAMIRDIMLPNPDNLNPSK